MKELNEEDILKNRVNTLPQYYILDYLKKNINISEFKLYIVDRYNIKVVDKTNDYLYFNYDEHTKEITYQKELKAKKQDYEIGL